MARIDGTSAKNGYGFYAILTEQLGTNYLDTNTTKVNYEVYIVNVNARTESGNWTFNAKIDGANVYNKTGQTLKTNDVDYNEPKLVFSGSKDVKHNTDGTKTITFSSTLSKSSYSSYDPGKCSLSGTFKLTDIPRASSLTTSSTFVNFGDSVRIDIGRNVETYTDTINWVGYYPKDNGDGSYSLQGGEPSDIKGIVFDETTQTFCEKTDLESITWKIPEELSTLIPTLRMVGVKLTCSTYNGDTLIGTTEKWLSIRLVEENAKPLITKSYVETNTQIIDQLGTNDFSIPVLNVSQPEFTFSATPRYNATIKSLKIICDDGQESSESPYTFRPIGSAKFTILATDSRDYTTTILVDLSANAIPYIKPNIKKLEANRVGPTSGEIIINANGSWYGGTMIDDIENSLNTNYKCKITGSEENPTLVEIPSEAVTLNEEKNEWYISNYSLGSITEYNKNYDFTLIIGDYYYSEISLKTLIKKGVPTFDYGEHDFQVNGDLFVADEDRQNKVNILESINKLSNEIKDSSWENATLTSAFKTYGSDTSPEYRKIGKVVEIRGQVSPNSAIESGGTATIFTLPEGYRPSKTVFTLCQGSGKNSWLLTIANTGDVMFARYGTSANAQCPTNAWLPFSATFTID